MNKKNKQKPEPFLLLFPWGKMTGAFLLFLLVSLFVYRLSEAGGIHVNRACLAAIVTATAGGGCGLYVIGKMWRKEIYWVLMGAMIGGVIRLLIGGIGTAIITAFTDIHRSWYIVFLGVYYVAFLVMDTGLALWMLRHSYIGKQEDGRRGNFWDNLS
ncbi:MAG: hypothetical protein ACYSU8_11595 [Planctomycetota bacterium]|jgi:hypothetical protein